MFLVTSIIVRVPIIGLIKWLRSKGLKVCSYVEKCAEFKNQTFKQIGWYTKMFAQRNNPRYAISQNSAKKGVPLQVYTLKKCYISSKMQILAANNIK